MKIGIIGAKGFLGVNLCLQAKQLDYKVNEYSSSDATGINPQTGLLPESFHLHDDIDVLFYLAQSPFYRGLPAKFEHVFSVNHYCAVKAAKMAVENKIPRFIYASTGNVYKPSFEPLSEDAELNRGDWYALSKIHAEECLSLLRDDIDITVIRLFGLFGPGQKDKLVPALIRKINQDEAVIIERNPRDENDFEGLRISLCYIDDAVGMLLDLINKPRIPYINIAGEKAVSIKQLSLKIAELLDRDVTHILSDNYRKCDLISDNTLLKEMINPTFTDMSIALEKTVLHRHK